MSTDDWKRSEVYHNSFLIHQDSTLDSVIANSAAQGLPDIAVTAAQGKFLGLVARSIGAKNVIEVGTLGGYSTIWLARAAQPGGQVTTFELDEKHAQVARDNFKTAGVKNVEVITGSAVETLPKFKPVEAIDLAFIDADKESNLLYFREAKRLVRKGGVIIVDNVVRSGRVSNENISDKTIEGVRTLLKAIHDDPEVDAVTTSTLGEKGWDGFVYALRL